MVVVLMLRTPRSRLDSKGIHKLPEKHLFFSSCGHCSLTQLRSILDFLASQVRNLVKNIKYVFIRSRFKSAQVTDQL